MDIIELVDPSIEDVSAVLLGEECYAVYGASLYFAVGAGDADESGSWRDTSTTHPIQLRIVYYDSGTEAITVGYTTDGTTETTGTVVTKGNTSKWKVKYYTLSSSAKFGTSYYADNLMADFRLYSDGDLFISNVSIADTTQQIDAQVDASGKNRTFARDIASLNFVSGSAGWQITQEGDAEFNSVTVRGTIYATAGQIASWNIGTVDAYTISADSGKIKLNSQTPSISMGESVASSNSGYSSGVGIWMGKYASTDWRFRVGDPSGNYMSFNQSTGALTVNGSITATTGLIGNWTIGANTISSGNISLNSATPKITIGTATDYLTTGNGVFMGNDGGTYKFRVGTTSKYFAFDGTNPVASGNWMDGNGVETSLQTWTTNIVFSSASATQVNWTSGTIRLNDGRTFSISSGNTGTMSALNYIYLDTAVSSTVLQKTTTYSTAVGSGKVIVAAAQNNATGASVIPFGGQQPILDGGAQIIAASITVGQLAANSVVASNISVSNLSSISADMGTITAGTITGATIRTSASNPKVQMDTSGIIGVDSSGTTKFSLSSSTGVLTATGATIQTATSGTRILEDTTGLFGYSGSSRVFALPLTTISNYESSGISIDAGDFVLGTKDASNVFPLLMKGNELQTIGLAVGHKSFTATSTVSGVTNCYDPGGYSFIRYTGSTAATIKYIKKPTTSSAKLLYIKNDTQKKLTLSNNQQSPPAGGTYVALSLYGADVVMPSYGTCVLIYDNVNLRWALASKKADTTNTGYQPLSDAGYGEDISIASLLPTATVIENGIHISAKGGGTLQDDMVVDAATTWTTTLLTPMDGVTQLLDDGDICYITDGTNVTWFTVVFVSNDGDVQTYTSTFVNGDRPVTYPAGTGVVDYGQSGQGFIKKVGNSGAPYFSVQTHVGSPYSAVSERVRIGNLDGSFGVSSVLYGIAAGDYDASNYMRYDEAEGFLLKAGNGAITLDKDGFHTAIVQIDDLSINLGGGADRERSPSSVADDSGIGTVAWSDVNYAKERDTNYASVYVDQAGGTDPISHYLELTDFGFSIPSSATILGVYVQVLGYSTGYVGGGGVNIQLLKSGALTGSAGGLNLSTTNPPTSYLGVGSQTSLWDATLSYSDINNSGFGVSIWVDNSGSYPYPLLISIDHVKISVYYQTQTGQILVNSNGNYFDRLLSRSDVTISASAPKIYMTDETTSAKSLTITTDANKTTFKEAAGTDILTLDLSNKSVVVGSAALSTSATDGFLYVNTTAGAPSGIPTSWTGRAALNIDTTNDRIYYYNGGWKYVSGGVGGLNADTLDSIDSTGFFILAGQSGGQTAIGGTGSGNNLTLKSTSHATKGKIIFGNAGTSAYDEVNERFGIGTASPSVAFDLKGSQLIDGASDTIQLRIQGDASQTANLQTWENSSGTVQAGISSDGRMGVGVAPTAAYSQYVKKFATDQTWTGQGIETWHRLTSTSSAYAAKGIYIQSLHLSDNVTYVGDWTGSIVALQATTGLSGTKNLSGAQVGNFFLTASGGGTLTNGYGIVISAPIVTGGSAITNNYGLYISSQTAGATLNYALYTNAGLVHFGDSVDMSDGVNFIFNTTTGTKIGTGTSQKIGFFNATPIVQPNATTDLGTVLSNLGLRASGTAYPLTTSGSVQITGTNPFGYGTGAGGTVTQSTSKSTGVTLNKVVGTVTMNNAALAANTTVTFTLTNSTIAATDLLIINHTSGGTAGSYLVNAQVAAGSATINVRNITSGSLSEAIVLRFAVVKGVTS